MKISILIPTFNRRSILERTLPTVFAQRFPANEYEVVIVVDGSTDGTTEWLRRITASCALSIVEQPNGGLISARNTGLQTARGELVLLLDDDIECPPDLLAEHVAAHDGCERLVAFGANAVSEFSPENIFTDWARTTFDHWRSRLQTVGVRWPDDAELGANYSARRDLLLSLGGWDPRFRTRELEFGLRLWKAGVPFRFLPQATAYHVYDKADAMVGGDAGTYGREEVLLCRTHPGYRAVSAFAGMEERRGLTYCLRSSLALAPFDPDLLLRPLFFAASQVRRASRAKRAALQLLNLRQSTTMLRGALRETGSWRAYRREFSQRLPVLAYHHIGHSRPGAHPGLTVSPAHFERQIKGLLGRGYAPITPEQWHDWTFHGTSLPERPVLITFDDSYDDLAAHAFPVLEKYGCPAVVFVVTELLGQSNVWDEEAGWGSRRLLTAEQIRHWSQRGIVFGAHSRTHPDLKMLNDHDLEAEVAGSCEDLAMLLGSKPIAFAYPYGEYDQRVRACVAKHYKMAFTTDCGWNTLKTDNLKLKRIVVDPGDGWLGLAVRLWFEPVQRVRNFLTVRTRLANLVRRKPAGVEHEH